MRARGATGSQNSATFAWNRNAMNTGWAHMLLKCSTAYSLTQNHRQAFSLGIFWHQDLFRTIQRHSNLQASSHEGWSLSNRMKASFNFFQAIGIWGLTETVTVSAALMRIAWVFVEPSYGHGNFPGWSAVGVAGLVSACERPQDVCVQIISASFIEVEVALFV